MTDNSDETKGQTLWDPASDEPIRVPKARHPIANAILIMCGLFAMASPLLLWISWTKEMLTTIFFTSLVCIVICYIIVRLDPE